MFMKSESDSEPGRQASVSLQLTGSKISQRIEFYRLTGLSTEKPTHRQVSRQLCYSSLDSVLADTGSAHAKCHI